jgi:methionyl-tRNA formyltransferase
MRALYRSRIVFIGAVHEALPALTELLACPGAEIVLVLTATPGGAAARSGAVDLVTPASREGVPVLLSDDANAPAVVRAIRALAPDLVVVIGWNQPLRPELLSIPLRGCVGFQVSLPSAERGHAPVNWAILRGETAIDNTMIMLDPRAGAAPSDGLAQRAVPIGPRDTCATVYRQVGQASAEMLIEHLPELVRGTIPRWQRPAGSEVLPRRTPEMGVINWDQSPRAVHDWVRALTVPYPGAFTLLNGRQVMVWATELPGLGEPFAPAGQIAGLEPNGIRVGTRGGSVLVTRMSEAGRPPEHARRWYRRGRSPLGSSFDPVPEDVVRWSHGEGRNPAAVVG